MNIEINIVTLKEHKDNHEVNLVLEKVIYIVIQDIEENLLQVNNLFKRKLLEQMGKQKLEYLRVHYKIILVKHIIRLLNNHIIVNILQDKNTMHFEV